MDHPLEFGKQMINWDQWSKEPGRALGNTAFGFIPVAGVVAKARKLRNVAKAAPDAPNVRPNLHNYFTGGAKPKASELDAWANAQGWTKTQTESGRRSTSTTTAWSGLRSRKAAPPPRPG